MITPIQHSKVNTYPVQYKQTSFTSIHRVRCIVKGSDGRLYQVLDEDLIGQLQQQIIKLLNKDTNDARNMMLKPGYKPKAIKDSKMKEIKERIVRFFINRDADYRHRKEVRSFYTKNRYGDAVSYIFSGDMVTKADDAAKPIGRVRRTIKNEANNLSERMDLEIEDARKQVQDAYKGDLDTAKGNYYADVETLLAEELAKRNPKDTQFDAYFEMVQIGKKIKYYLYDAKLGGK